MDRIGSIVRHPIVNPLSSIFIAFHQQRLRPFKDAGHNRFRRDHGKESDAMNVHICSHWLNSSTEPQGCARWCVAFLRSVHAYCEMVNRAQHRSLDC
jgi:hypothetical protein